MRRPWTQRFALEAPDARLARAVFVLLLAVYSLTFNGLPAGIDGEVSFQTTSALARRGSFDLGGTPEARGLIEASDAALPGGFSVRRVERAGELRHYAWFGVGGALVGLPFYVMGKSLAVMSTGTQARHSSHERFGHGRSEYFEHLFVGWRNPLLAALTACLLVLAARRLGISRSAAFVGGMGYGLCTFAWPQARAWHSDVQAAFCLCAAFYCFLLLRENWSARRCAALGAALSLGLLTRASLLPALVVMDLAFLWLVPRFRRAGERVSGWRSVAACGAPQVLALVLWLVTNRARFGSVLDSGYGESLAAGLFGGDPRQALMGLLFSPSKGLLWMAPGLVLIFAGVLRARQEREAVLVWGLLLSSLAVVLPILFLVGWHGAWTWGPRYVLPALPLLWVLAMLGFQRSALDSRVRPLAWALCALGLFTQIPGALVDSMTYHDLAVRAAGEHFRELASDPAATPADVEEQHFAAMQFDWGFAAPLVHWRILRQRVALGTEDFPSSEIFRYPTSQVLRPSQPRERGFGHLAWVDLQQRLGGKLWLVAVLCSLLVLRGCVDAVRGLDP